MVSTQSFLGAFSIKTWLTVERHDHDILTLTHSMDVARWMCLAFLALPFSLLRVLLSAEPGT